MQWVRQGIRTELRPMLSLAGPVILAELGWLAMGIVDTLFVGRLGAEAIGAVSLGSALYFSIAIFGIGLLLGLDTLVSQAYGAGRRDECHGWLVQALYLCLALSPPVMLLLSGGIPWLGRLGMHPAVMAQAVPFLRALTWGTFPLFLYAAFRRYLQGIGLVKPVMFALVGANVINAIGDWILIYGHLGVPTLGVTGSGWATTIARIYMAAVLTLYAVYHELRYKTGLRHVSFRPDLVRICRLLVIGLPAAVHVTLEAGVFAVATILAGMLDPVALAAHHIVLDISSVTFMIPLGLASAGAVRVGLPLGYLLAFTAGCGIIGLWVGLALGLGASGLYLLRAWWRKSQALARGKFTLAGAFAKEAPPLTGFDWGGSRAVSSQDRAGGA